VDLDILKCPKSTFCHKGILKKNGFDPYLLQIVGNN